MGADASVPEKDLEAGGAASRDGVGHEDVARAIKMHQAACRIQAHYRGKRDRASVQAIVVEKRRLHLSQHVSGLITDASSAVHSAHDLAHDLANEAVEEVHRLQESVHLTQDEVEDRTVDLEAMHTMGLLFPVIGISIASWSAAGFYLNDPHYILNGTTDSRYYDYTADQVIKEPFATMCNLCYIVSGFSYFVVQFLSGGAMPEQTYGLGVMLLLEGAASFAFHRDGSRTQTWAHQADRFGMYIQFTYCACVVWNGAYHALRGQPVQPRSFCSLVTNFAALFCVFFFLVQQAEYEAMPLLIGCGFVIWGVNLVSLSLLHARATSALEVQTFSQTLSKLDTKLDTVSRAVTRRGAGRQRSRRKLSSAQVRLLRAFAMVALPSTATQLFALGIGFWCNMLSDEAKVSVVRGARLPFDEAVLQRQRHDMLHGTWHFLTAVPINTTGYCLINALSGRFDQPEMRFHWAERLAVGISLLLTASLAAMAAADAPPMAFLAFWIGVSVTAMPLLCFALACQVRRHNELVGLADRKLRMPKRPPARPSTVAPAHGLRMPRMYKHEWHVAHMLATVTHHRHHEPLPTSDADGSAGPPAEGQADANQKKKRHKKKNTLTQEAAPLPTPSADLKQDLRV